MSHKLKVQYWPIDEVKPYPNNPRNNDDSVEYVANSIREFSFQQPIVVDNNGTIIAGHTRLKAAKMLGMETVPVVVADNLTPAQVNAYRLADNKVAEAATWDMEALAVELEGLEVDFDMSDFGIEIDGDWFTERERNDTSRQEGNDEYNEFVDKFEVKKTTDDCYTPDLVYDAVLGWVREEYGIPEGAKIVRPFYPNGDYEHEDYPDGCVVVDNPPFSILSEILRFYVDNSVKFFLFAPTLTLFSPRVDKCCFIPTNARVRYENGAIVDTSFVTNLDTENRIKTAPSLYEAVTDAVNDYTNEQVKTSTLKYKYPSHVVTAAMVGSWCRMGIDFSVPNGNAVQIGCLDAQKEYDKGIYGSGFLLSDECARDAERAKADAERAKALEAAKALGDGVEVEPDGSVVWRLSEREMAIVKSIGEVGKDG